MKVHYFPSYGRAEAIRMLLAHAKVEFENVDYTRESFAEAKAAGNFEFGQLPVLEMEGKLYAQSTAIVRALGIYNGYYPTDAYDAYRADSIIDSLQDLTQAYYKAHYNEDEEAKKALFEVFFSKTLPTWFGII